MKSEDDIKHCKTDEVPDEVIIKTEAQSKKNSIPYISKKRRMKDNSKKEFVILVKGIEEGKLKDIVNAIKGDSANVQILALEVGTEKKVEE